MTPQPRADNQMVCEATANGFCDNCCFRTCERDDHDTWTSRVTARLLRDPLKMHSIDAGPASIEGFYGPERSVGNAMFNEQVPGNITMDPCSELIAGYRLTET